MARRGHPRPVGNHSERGRIGPDSAPSRYRHNGDAPAVPLDRDVLGRGNALSGTQLQIESPPGRGMKVRPPGGVDQPRSGRPRGLREGSGISDMFAGAVAGGLDGERHTVRDTASLSIASRGVPRDAPPVSATPRGTRRGEHHHPVEGPGSCPRSSSSASRSDAAEERPEKPREDNSRNPVGFQPRTHRVNA